MPSNPYALARSVIAGKAKLPQGLTLSKPGNGKSVSRSCDGETRPWAPEEFVPDAHEAEFRPIGDYEHDTLRRADEIYCGKRLIVITGQEPDTQEPGSLLQKGKRTLYKRFYPMPEWTAEQALVHAVDGKAIGFTADADRIHRLRPAPLTVDDISVRRVTAEPEEPVAVRRLTTTEAVETAERERAGGRVIY